MYHSFIYRSFIKNRSLIYILIIIKTINEKITICLIHKQFRYQARYAEITHRENKNIRCYSILLIANKKTIQNKLIKH